jgi:hypothetical protein
MTVTARARGVNGNHRQVGWRADIAAKDFSRGAGIPISPAFDLACKEAGVELNQLC